MSAEAQLADEVVKVTIDGMVYLIKGTADVVGYIGAMVDDKNKSSNTAGKVKMKELIKEGGDIKLYEVPAEKLKQIVKEAKPFALKYSVCTKHPNRLEEGDKVLIAVPLSQAPLFERVVEKCKVFEVVTEMGTAENTKDDTLQEDIEEKSEGEEKQEPVNESPEKAQTNEKKEEQKKQEDVSFAETTNPELLRTGTEETRSVNNSKDVSEMPKSNNEKKKPQEEISPAIIPIPKIDKDELEEISKNMELGYFDKRFRPSVLKEQMVYAAEKAAEINDTVQKKVKEVIVK